MFKNLIVFCFILAFSSTGCVPLLLGAGVGSEAHWGRKTLAQLAEKNRKNVSKLSYGISKRFAAEIMGSTPVKVKDGNTASEIPHPYRTGHLEGTDWDVLYYVVFVNYDDEKITDDELVPLFFENDKLIGWGWSFLDSSSK